MQDDEQTRPTKLSAFHLPWHFAHALVKMRRRARLPHRDELVALISLQDQAAAIDANAIGRWERAEVLPRRRNMELVWGALEPELRRRGASAEDIAQLRAEYLEAYTVSAFGQMKKFIAKFRIDQEMSEAKGDVAYDVSTPANPPEKPSSDTRALLRIGLPFGPEVSIWPGADHPQHTGMVPPDNLEALDNLWMMFDRVELQERAFEERAGSIRHFWTLGSSTSTAEVGDIFGRIEDGAFSGLTEATPVSLKWTFGRTRQSARRFVGGVEDDRPLTGLFETAGRSLRSSPVSVGAGSMSTTWY